MDSKGYAQAVVDEAIRTAGGENEFLSLTPNGRRRQLHLAGESLKYRFPGEFEAAAFLSTAFQVYRINGNRVDIGKALKESEEVRQGMEIQRAIGQRVLMITRKEKKVIVPAVTAVNGKNHAAAHAAVQHQAPPLFVVDPEDIEPLIQGKPTKVDRSRERRPMLDVYRDMADQVAVLPTDDAVVVLTGCHPSTPGKCREMLRREGYDFERVDIPAKPSGTKRFHLWRVTVKGSEAKAALEKAAKAQAEAEAKARAEHEKAEQARTEAARQETISAFATRVSNMSADELAQLAAILQK